ncbi:CDP-diacylglycerol--serine O-phosphatidyltransferase [Orenia metallireducens]|jgi:CDP-diacylglycerol--serine O-phosphatidyltransferase|uniref:CDP-diacylglycerol--serine O-phosphatidyltransferase n=1 Tax=Orenia metallireducens TaxID=1413210 RepID=A0A1C0AAW4_9FIRM|nr:CDP-diacylglycerol--serine O-phosphatidyltransferase [Orenia metallireducens]OCL27525.1 CDP-diacylglycerol--serine O-phosphatidyltransferase [Orenia metallireducens]
MNRIEKRFVIPNIITGANMLLGFLSIIMSFQGDLLKASWLIVMAMVADGLDGKTARALDGFSEFGKEFDSFCDAVSFGMAPGILIYSILMEQVALKELIIPLSFLYLLCGVLRLVKFNIITEASKDKADFIGMPIPTAAGLLASYNIFSNAVWGELVQINLFLILAFFVSILMVSAITFKSISKTFKVLDSKGLLALLILVAVFAKYLLFPFGLSYFLVNSFNFIKEKRFTSKEEVS